jgi:hypothetical protein
MNRQADRSKGYVRTAVDAFATTTTTPKEDRPARRNGGAAETFDAGKASAKEIFEDARAKQEEEYIRRGKHE